MTLHTIRVPIKTVNEGNQRSRHWGPKATRTKNARKWTGLCLNASTCPKGFPARTITLTRIAPGMLDPGDNLSSALKAVRDEVAAHLGVDDGVSGPTWLYAQRKKHGTYEVLIEIEDT